MPNTHQWLCTQGRTKACTYYESIRNYGTTNTVQRKTRRVHIIWVIPRPIIPENPVNSSRDGNAWVCTRRCGYWCSGKYKYQRKQKQWKNFSCYAKVTNQLLQTVHGKREYMVLDKIKELFETGKASKWKKKTLIYYDISRYEYVYICIHKTEPKFIEKMSATSNLQKNYCIKLDSPRTGPSYKREASACSTILNTARRTSCKVWESSVENLVDNTDFT